MWRIFLILLLIGCRKDDTNMVTLKYAYITRDNIEYANSHYKVVTTFLCTYDMVLTIISPDVKQDRLCVKLESMGDMVVADTLVGMDDNVTDI